MGIELECNWEAGFVMNPNETPRIGYLLNFEGLNMPGFLKPDLEVFTPYENPSIDYPNIRSVKNGSKIRPIGIIDKFSFAGGVGDPICISAYISAENAQALASKQKSTLDTTIVKKLSWWICNFDQENKAWFEEAHPKSPSTVRGQLNAPGGSKVRLQIDANPTKISSSLDLNVYKLYFEVIPSADGVFLFHFATTSKTKYIKGWGLKIGD
jgi:hypothetical protein